MSREFRRFHCAILFLAASFCGTPSLAADHLTTEEVRAAASAASKGTLDLSGKILTGDDLNGLDLTSANLTSANLTGANLTGANLAGANLHGTKLVGANLSGADLSGSDLTFAWIMRANFTNARLHGAIMRSVVTSTGMDNTPDQAAIFVGADLSDALITVHFSYDDMRGANFSRAHMTVDMANQSMGMLRTEFIAAKLDGADFTDAGLGHVIFRFAKLKGARFNGADLSYADFTGADLSGADFTGAKVSETTFEAATLPGVKGLSRPAPAGTGKQE